MSNLPRLIFDFDSTFIQDETLEALASVAFKNDPEADTKLKHMIDLTNAAMSGQLDFEATLLEKLSLLTASRKHIDGTIELLSQRITPSILKNKAFFNLHAEEIYIISGGFEEIIWPIVKPFGIKQENIFANRFLYNYQGKIIGIDQNNPLSKTGGKVKLLQQLNFDSNSIIIGDGHNDYELKAAGCVKQFYAFVENIRREQVVEKADQVLTQLEDLFKIYDIKIARPNNRIVLLENIHPAVKQHFLSEGWEVVTHEGALVGSELNDALAHAQAIGIRSKTVLTDEIIKANPQLLAIGAFCIGTNQINLKSCSELGVAVFNAPYSNTRSVVELAVSEMISLMRDIPTKNAALHQGKWEKSANGAHEVRGKTLGIIGYGNIGAQLSILAENLGMQVYFYDIAEKLPLGNAQPCKSLNKLLSMSDIISIHVDGRGENQQLINQSLLSKMKKGAVLLNLSRGFVVDEMALANALDSGHLKGAAIDVFPEEPKNNKIPFQSPLQGLSNVILTPHIGGSTEEAQAHIGDFVFNRIHEYVSIGTTLSSVNFPEIKLPHHANTHRIIHIHQNMPGRLAEINGIFANYKVNIEGQYLQTQEEIGYVITDIGKDYNKELINELNSIQHTKRVRVLY